MMSAVCFISGHWAVVNSWNRNKLQVCVGLRCFLPTPLSQQLLLACRSLGSCDCLFKSRPNLFIIFVTLLMPLAGLFSRPTKLGVLLDLMSKTSPSGIETIERMTDTLKQRYSGCAFGSELFSQRHTRFLRVRRFPAVRLYAVFPLHCTYILSCRADWKK